MNITQMHTAIDVGVNHLNSQHYRKITGNVKDIIINDCILDFANTAMNDVGKTIMGYDSSDQIASSVANLRTLITGAVLAYAPNANVMYSNYNTYNIFSHDVGAINSGVIHQGLSYYVVNSGTTDWSNVFDGSVSDGDVKTATLPILSADSGIITLYDGLRYSIIEKGSFDWSIIGLQPYQVHNGMTIKIPTNGLIKQIPSGTGVELQMLSAYPNLISGGWVDSTLYTIDNLNMIAPYVINANVSSRIINKGTVTPGTYIIMALEDGDNLNAIGAPLTATVGDTFTCGVTSNVNFTNGSTVAKVRHVPVQNLTSEFVRSMQLDDNYTTSVRPVSTIDNDSMKVYHNSNFNVHNVHMTYIRMPRRVSSEYNISCDLHESVHGSIVTAAIAKCIAYIKGENYQAVKAEQATNSQKHRL